MVPLEIPRGFPGMQKETYQNGEKIGANTHPISKTADQHWSILYISPLHMTLFGKKKGFLIMKTNNNNKILSQSNIQKIAQTRGSGKDMKEECRNPDNGINAWNNFFCKILGIDLNLLEGGSLKSTAK